MRGSRRLHLTLTLSLASLPIGAAQPVAGETLVLDINTKKNGNGGDLHSSPTLLLTVNGIAYFAADDGCFGRELWRTDGTPAGTVLVADVFTGEVSSQPRDMVMLPDGTLLFVATHSISGTELWRSDGTAAGTSLVKDIHPNYASGFPTAPVVFQGRAWFSADDGTGDELWTSDGTSSGTQKFIDLNPAGAAHDHSTFRIRAVGNRLFFSRRFPSAELWVTDGTFAGTTSIASFAAIAGYECLRTFGEASGYLVFDGWDGTHGNLWRSDGTAAGTTPVAAVHDPTWFVTVGSFAFFPGVESGQGYELFVTNTTPSGTARVVNLAPGPSDGIAEDAIAAVVGNGIVYFGWTSATGVEPIYSDGTTIGTFLLADTIPGSGSSFVETSVLAYGSGAVFTAANRPWFTDGTAAGTVKLSDATEPVPLGACAAGFLLQARDSVHGRELWLTDGTPAGTQLLMDVHAEATRNSNPRYFLSLGDRALFQATDEVVGNELWSTDGTAAGTTLVIDIAPGPADSYPVPLATIGGVALLAADDGATGYELWRSDGTAAGTFRLADIMPGPGSGLVDGSWLAEPFLKDKWCVHGGKLYFRAAGPSGAEPWVSDGTANGTVQLVDLVPGAGSSSPTAFAPLGDHVYFAATTPATGKELWRTDGTAAGTQLVSDIEPGPSDSNPSHLVAVQDRLYLLATTSAFGSELWRHDAAGTALVLDIRPGPMFGALGPIVALDGVVLFVGNDAAHGNELWRSDGTAGGTFLLADLEPGGAGSLLQAITAAGTQAYFTRSPYQRLYGTDGTVAGTRVIKEVTAFGPSPFSNESYWRFGSDHRVIFSGWTYTHGSEPWVTDGTEPGTERIADLAPYEKWFSPIRGARVGDRLLLAGNDGATGFELHVIPFGATGGWVVEPYGQGCGGTNGGPRLDATSGPIPASTFTLELTDAPASSPWLLSFALGRAALPLGGGCTFYLSAPFFLAPASVTDTAGSSTLPLPIPMHPALPGLLVDLQTIVLPAGGAPPPFTAASNGLEIVIGG